MVFFALSGFALTVPPVYMSSTRIILFAVEEASHLFRTADFRLYPAFMHDRVHCEMKFSNKIFNILNIHISTSRNINTYIDYEIK